jgi:hypothetical protein
MLRTCFCFSGITGILISAVAACTLDFPDSAGRVIERGDNFQVRLIESAKGSVKTAETRFFVHASREKCWRVITDYRHYPEFMPNIKAARPEPLAPKGAVYYAFVLGAGLWNINYTINLTASRSDTMGWSLAWTYIKGDIESTTGSWNISECKEMPGWVLVRYRVCVDAGKLVPAWVSTLLTTKSIPGLIKAVRERTGEKIIKG